MKFHFNFFSFYYTFSIEILLKQLFLGEKGKERERKSEREPEMVERRRDGGSEKEREKLREKN